MAHVGLPADTGPDLTPRRRQGRQSLEERQHLRPAQRPVVPSITSIVYSSMIRSFSLRVREDGYQILLFETGFELVAEEVAILVILWPPLRSC